MKIQKGMVKYKDRNDIICIYGVTDEGKTYYFLNNDGISFTNGNYVASTELVEAIDPMYKASKVGVINSEGKEVIPCENKGVKPITDEVILVEKAVPTTESVLQAIEHRSDSLHAAQLVSTPAQIKDSIYHEMGNDGRFLFNDQFAEATVYDINGNNLVNGEVYSFIAMNNDHLYLSKNVPESPVVRFALSEKKVEETVSAEKTEVEVPDSISLVSTSENNEQPVQEEDKEKIDVNDVNVPMEVVESALESTQASETEYNVIQDNFDVDTHTPLENVNAGLDTPSTDDIMAATNLEIPIVHEDFAKADDAVREVATEITAEETKTEETAPVYEVPSTDETENVSEKTEDAALEIVSNIDDVTEHVEEEMVAPEADTEKNEEVVEETTNETFEEVPSVDSAMEEVVEKTPVEEEVELHVTDDSVIDEEVVEETPVEDKEAPLDEKDIQTLLDETSMDLFGGSPLQVDSIASSNDELDNYTFSIPETCSADSIYEDVAKTMSGLIKQVKDLRATNANYEEIIDGLNADKAELHGKVTALEHQNVELSDRNRALENGVIKLKTRIEMLASKVHEKDETINSLNGELTELRHQTAGKAKLFSLMRDAQALVEESNVEEDIDDYSYIKAA